MKLSWHLPCARSVLSTLQILMQIPHNGQISRTVSPHFTDKGKRNIWKLITQDAQDGIASKGWNWDVNPGHILSAFPDSQQ